MDSAQKGNIAVALIVLIAATAIIIGYFKIQPIKQIATPSLNPAIKTPIPTATNSAQTKVFKSSNVLRFSILVPEGSQVVERLGSVTISSAKGIINIGQNGTNFDNLNDFILNSPDHLNTRLIQKKQSLINGLDSVNGFIGNEKIYFIYSRFNIYLLSTSSVTLYGDLDQIARSFRYNP